MPDSEGDLRATPDLRSIRATVESAVLGAVAARNYAWQSWDLSGIADATPGLNSATDGGADADNVNARLPSHPAPFTPEEMREVRAALAHAGDSRSGAFG